MIILCLLFALVGLTSAQVELSASENNFLEKLCKNESVPLTRISEALEVIAKLEENVPENCHQITVDGLNDLQPLISEGMDNVCSRDKIEQIGSFKSKYIDSSAGLPTSINEFFFGLSLKISSACKKALLNGFTYDADIVVPRKDMEIAQPYIEENMISSLRALFGRSDYNDLLIAYDLAIANAGTEKVYVQMRMGAKLRQLQEACSRSFKPVYQPLLEPVILLKNLGINFEEDEKLKKMAEDEEARKWFRLVYICESLANLGIVDLKPEESRVMDGKTIRLITYGKAQKILGEKFENEDQAQKIEWQPSNQNPIGDKVLDYEDKNLIKAIDHLTDHRNMFDIFKNVGKFVKEMILNDRINIVGDWIAKMGNIPNGNRRAKLIMDIEESLDKFNDQTLLIQPRSSQQMKVDARKEAERKEMKRRTLIDGVKYLVIIGFVAAIIAVIGFG